MDCNESRQGVCNTGNEHTHTHTHTEQAMRLAEQLKDGLNPLRGLCSIK